MNVFPKQLSSSNAEYFRTKKFGFCLVQVLCLFFETNSGISDNCKLDARKLCVLSCWEMACLDPWTVWNCTTLFIAARIFCHFTCWEITCRSPFNVWKNELGKEVTSGPQVIFLWRSAILTFVYYICWHWICFQLPSVVEHQIWMSHVKSHLYWLQAACTKQGFRIGR